MEALIDGGPRFAQKAQHESPGARREGPCNFAIVMRSRGISNSRREALFLKTVSSFPFKSIPEIQLYLSEARCRCGCKQAFPIVSIAVLFAG